MAGTLRALHDALPILRHVAPADTGPIFAGEARPSCIRVASEARKSRPCCIWNGDFRGQVHQKRAGRAFAARETADRKSTRLNSSHVAISSAGFRLIKK